MRRCLESPPRARWWVWELSEDASAVGRRAVDRYVCQRHGVGAFVVLDRSACDIVTRDVVAIGAGDGDAANLETVVFGSVGAEAAHEDENSGQETLLHLHRGIVVVFHVVFVFFLFSAANIRIISDMTMQF